MYLILVLWCHLYGGWEGGYGGLVRPAPFAGSFAQFDSAMRFSSPGDLPSSAAFSRLQWQSETHLSCARRLLSSWQKMHETTSALVALPSPEMVMAPRYISCDHHADVSPLFQPLVRPCFSMGLSALRTRHRKERLEAVFQ